jgi:beta-galactosidase
VRGVAAHQDHKGTGSAAIREKIAEDVDMILDIGANTVRLAHYQHPQAMYDLCDEKGIIVWAEIPYISLHMKNGRANTLSQMEELIVQNYNHPSIAVWGLSNEITAASAVTEELLENHRALNDLAHKLDAVRSTTMANVFMLETTSPILDIPDVNSYNLYFGWYIGELDQNEDFFDTFHAKFPNKPIGLAEYGADANPAFQSTAPEKGDYTETYQCVYHEHMAKIIAERPWLWATHVWNMFDFAADGRDEGGKHGENQKGLVTFDRKIKKDAFYLYKAYWSKEPFVHLCGSRYVDRPEAETEIKVYSNLPEVSLYVDGKLVETKKAERIFTFTLAISGEHTVEARAEGCADTITVRKVDAPNPAYSMPNRQEVNNWFDGELDESCWSVKDNMAAAMAHPKAGAVMKQVMDKAAASRGDVATSVKDNPALVAMMQQAMKRMTIEGLLKQAGADPESIKQLNRVLQTISKNG